MGQNNPFHRIVSKLNDQVKLDLAQQLSDKMAKTIEDQMQCLVDDFGLTWPEAMRETASQLRLAAGNLEGSIPGNG